MYPGNIVNAANAGDRGSLAACGPSFTYQLQNNGAYLVSGIQKTGYNSGTGKGQYAFAYNSNNQVKAVVDEVGNRSTFVWDSFGNRAAVIDPFGQRTSYIYDSMGRLSAVRNALNQRATQTYDSQGRRLADINPLGQRTSYAYDVNSQRLRSAGSAGAHHDHAARQHESIDRSDRPCRQPHIICL